MAEIHAQRLARLRAAMAAANIPALYTTHPFNRRYLTGYTGEDHLPNESAGAVLVLPDAAYLHVARLNAAQARTQAPEYTVVDYFKRSDIADQTKALAARHAFTRLGFEEDSILYATHKMLTDALPGVTLEPVGTLASQLRAVKDGAEIASLRRAQAITVAAFTAVAPHITAGMTEKQVAWELEKAVRDAGGAGMAFSTIVGAGENGARPHHGASDRPIREGEPIVIDMGAVYEGYCGDLTRTIVVGEPDEKFRKVYDVVLRAMRHVEEIAHPGMKGGEIDAAAREIITEAGYGEYFIHTLGHGVGLQVHEGPSARVDGEDVYGPGMTLTVEPGIYLEGWGGVRIEDLVIFTEHGIENLTDAPVM